MTETDACLRQTFKKICTIYSKFLKTTTKCFHQSGQKELAMALNSTQSPEKKQNLLLLENPFVFHDFKDEKQKERSFYWICIIVLSVLCSLISFCFAHLLQTIPLTETLIIQTGRKHPTIWNGSALLIIRNATHTHTQQSSLPPLINRCCPSALSVSSYISH